MPGGAEEPSRWLDLDHLAELANLPLDEDEPEEMAEACRDVLATFQLEAVEEPEDEAGGLTPFADEPRPWPEEGVEAIVEAFPERDGRELRS